MQDSIPGPQGHALSRRQMLNRRATQAPLEVTFQGCQNDSQAKTTVEDDQLDEASDLSFPSGQCPAGSCHLVSFLSLAVTPSSCIGVSVSASLSHVCLGILSLSSRAVLEGHCALQGGRGAGSPPGSAG